MKKLYPLVPILTIAGFLAFSWHLKALPRLYTSETSYFIHRLIMALWLVIPGFSLELPRLWPYFTGKTAARTDWPFLLISGIPALFFALLPLFVTVLHLKLPGLLAGDSARVMAESIGAFWFGITLGKSIVLEA